MLVEIEKAAGSTPREVGASMLVTADACHGTIGGGQLEWDALAHARRMLSSRTESDRRDVPLGPEIGQCCGGRVSLRYHIVDQAERERIRRREMETVSAQPTVMLFGAGHVGKAIHRVLETLPLRLRWIDERADQFPPGAAGTATERPVDHIAEAPAGAGFLILTHSHMMDFRLVEAVLRSGDFAYLGLIGSKSKRARFENGFSKLGLDSSRLVCPIGGDKVRDKRPEVIAALVAAELLTVFLQDQKP